MKSNWLCTHCGAEGYSPLWPRSVGNEIYLISTCVNHPGEKQVTTDPVSTETPVATEERMYKPLSDEEIKWYVVNHNLSARVMIQLERANALAAVLTKYHFSGTYTERAEKELEGKLAAYLGETHD